MILFMIEINNNNYDKYFDKYFDKYQKNITSSLKISKTLNNPLNSNNIIEYTNFNDVKDNPLNSNNIIEYPNFNDIKHDLNSEKLNNEFTTTYNNLVDFYEKNNKFLLAFNEFIKNINILKEDIFKNIFNSKLFNYEELLYIENFSKKIRKIKDIHINLIMDYLKKECNFLKDNIELNYYYIIRLLDFIYYLSLFIDKSIILIIMKDTTQIESLLNNINVYIHNIKIIIYRLYPSELPSQDEVDQQHDIKNLRYEQKICDKISINIFNDHTIPKTKSYDDIFVKYTFNKWLIGGIYIILSNFIIYLFFIYNKNKVNNNKKEEYKNSEINANNVFINNNSNNDNDDDNDDDKNDDNDDDNDDDKNDDKNDS